MKKTIKKSSALLLALLMIFSIAFSANATDFKSTKTAAFIDKLVKEKAVSVKMSDVELPLTDSLKVKGNNIVASIALKGEDDVDLKLSGNLSLSALKAKVYYDGKDIYGYSFIFKINVSKILANITGSDILITPEMKAEIAKVFNTITDLADSPVLSALLVESQSATVEKFSISPVALMVKIAGADEKTVNAALLAAGIDTIGKTDKEVKDMIVDLNNQKLLVPVLNAMGASVTQEELDSYMEYLGYTLEFTFKGNDVVDIAAYDADGNTVIKLSEMIPLPIAAISAGKADVKKPAFGIDITGIVNGIIKSIMSKIG